MKPPRAIGAAFEALEQRKAELAAAQAAHREAQAGIAVGRQRDTAEIAQALDSAQKAPPRRHQAAAEKAAAASLGELEVAQERVKTAAARLDEALEQGCQDWLKGIEEAWSGADTATVEAVEALRASLLERNSLVVARGWVRSLAEPASRAVALAQPAPTAGPGAISALIGPNGDPLSAEQVLTAITQHVAQTGLESILGDERAQRAEHERAATLQREHDADTEQRAAHDLAAAEAHDLRRPALP